jgi:ADP-glucose pyrophosphorylase
VTLATLPIRPDEVARFGVVEVSRTGEVVAFQEKPKTTNLRSPFNPTMVDASMGIYLFNTDVLLPALMKDAEDPNSKHDFGHNILPGILGRYKISAYNFVATWAHSKLISTPTWMWLRSRPSSTCMTKPGPCAPGSGNIRPPSSSSANQDVPAWLSTR